MTTSLKTVSTATALSLLLIGCSNSSTPVPPPVVQEMTQQSDYDKPLQRRDTQFVEATLKVSDINYSTRQITLEDSEGATQQVVAGPEVTRFAEIKRGDLVKVRMSVTLDVALETPGAEQAATVEAIAGRSPKSEPPGVGAVVGFESVVVISHIDREREEVEVTTKEGDRVTVKPRDSKNLDRLKVGDSIRVRYVEALAVSLEPAKK